MNSESQELVISKADSMDRGAINIQPPYTLILPPKAPSYISDEDTDRKTLDAHGLADLMLGRWLEYQKQSTDSKRSSQKFHPHSSQNKVKNN